MQSPWVFAFVGAVCAAVGFAAGATVGTAPIDEIGPTEDSSAATPAPSGSATDTPQIAIRGSSPRSA